MLVNNVKYRHEFKYICSDAQLECIKRRLVGLMHYDKHTDINGTYNVRSVYFDDYHNTYYSENTNGVDPREKFRIRIYNSQDSTISLERKRKERGMTNKESVRIERELCDMILSDKVSFLNLSGNHVWNCFANKYNNYQLRPKVIVDYDRTVFVCPLGNVRITFDRNISSSVDYSNFFKQSLKKRPIMECGQNVLEVKYDEVLPDYIYKAIELENLQRTSFSKYYLCRTYHS